ncbi:MAG: aspartate kinase [Firmicutes bacterium]|nr:aspartate kinase [Bacillota bacterium]
MSIKVAKFGGSSVADALQIDKIKKIIEEDGAINYVVVSAPGKRFKEDSKVTDLLYLCKSQIDHKVPFEQVFQVICDRYVSEKLNLGVDTDLQTEFNEIEQALREGTTADYIASRGEYLNAKVIADYIGYDFIDAADIVKFNEKGKFLEKETDEAIRAELSKHEKALIPGFYGAMPDGSIKTFPRGGSDITGALVAKAVQADVYENWTDVSGFLAADPRVVDNPRPISRISYKELRELSYMGASVLHEDAIYPARAENIPINIRNTNRPQDPGTLISSEPGKLEEGQIITGIAGRKDFTVINMYKNQMSDLRGFIRKLAAIFEEHDIPIEHMPSGVDTLSIVVSNSYISDKIDDIMEDIRNQLKPDTLDYQDNVALIATVGHGMSSRKGTAAQLFCALAKENINIKMIDQGSSEMNIIVGVENEDFENAVKAIYAAFEA